MGCVRRQVRPADACRHRIGSVSTHDRGVCPTAHFGRISSRRSLTLLNRLLPDLPTVAARGANTPSPATSSTGPWHEERVFRHQAPSQECPKPRSCNRKS